MLTLTQGASSIVVAPEHGAGLLGWMLDRTPILRRALPETAVGGNPHAMGCFPLLPYCNRIGQAQFTWGGTVHRLRHNFGDHPHSIHGIGWQRPWTVSRATPDTVTLTLAHKPDADWPFAFEASVSYALVESALRVTISLTNRHDAPAPAGIGLHPYFPKAHNPSLRFNATGVWLNGDDALPRRCGPPPAEWIHTEPRLIAESRLDNCFTGWDHAAEISAGPASLRIETSEAFGCLQVFTPSWADFFCVEPITHVPDAVNRLDLPPSQAMASLAPGATLAGSIRLIVSMP
ncbi:MAG TPA: aldose 1-epimerase [Rhodopila sp.]|nr:aldose 1-epimerase [Rhodopila sp.]